MSDDDVLRARRTLRLHGIPEIGDIYLVTNGDDIEVRVEVNGQWRTAIRTHYDGDLLISHFVAADGGKPLRWPASEDLTRRGQASR